MTSIRNVRLETHGHITDMVEPTQCAVHDLIERGKLSTDGIDEYPHWTLAYDLASKALVGCGAVELRPPIVYLESLVVDPRHRKAGIGRTIIDALCLEHVTNSPDAESMVALTLFWNNEFYRRAGFEQTNAKMIKQADDVASKAKHRYCTAWIRS